METHAEGVRALFDVYNRVACDNLDWIDFDTSLNELGSFAHLYIFNVNSLINCCKPGKETSLPMAISQCKLNLRMLKDKVDSEKFSFIISDSLELIEKLPSDKDASMKALLNYVQHLFNLLKIQSNRVAAQFKMNVSKKTTISALNQAINSFNRFNQTLDKITEGNPDVKLSDEVNDPFILNYDHYDRIMDYCDLHTRHAPQCPCGHNATVFAFPCHCPVGCKMCWVEPSEKVCPVCKKTVEQFVSIDE